LVVLLVCCIGTAVIYALNELSIYPTTSLLRACLLFVRYFVQLVRILLVLKHDSDRRSMLEAVRDYTIPSMDQDDFAQLYYSETKDDDDLGVESGPQVYEGTSTPVPTAAIPVSAHPLPGLQPHSDPPRAIRIPFAAPLQPTSAPTPIVTSSTSSPRGRSRQGSTEHQGSPRSQLRPRQGSPKSQSQTSQTNTSDALSHSPYEGMEDPSRAYTTAFENARLTATSKPR